MARGAKKATVEAGPVEGPWELPEGWRWERLGNLGRWGSGGTPKAKDPRFYGGPIVWYKIGDLTDGPLGASEQTITEDGLRASSAKLVPPDALLVAMYGSIGKLGITTVECTTNQAIAHFVPGDEVRLKWIYLAMLLLRPLLLEKGQGGTQQNISQTILLAQPVPVAPLPIQDKSIAFVEALFAEIDDGERALACATRDADTLERALIGAGTRGDLTSSWRAANPSPHSGDDLARQIQQECRTRFDASLKRKAGTYVAPRVTSGLVSDELPESWCRAPIGAVAECLDFMRVPINRKDRDQRAGPVPYYGANGQVGLIDEWLFDEPLVLVVEDETFTGRKAAFSYLISGKSWVNNHAHILRAGAHFSPEYLNITLSRYPFTPLTTGTTGRKKLTQAAMMGAEISVPPLREQAEIVKAIGQALESVTTLKACALHQKALSVSLRQSILAVAFRGDLVA